MANPDVSGMATRVDVVATGAGAVSRKRLLFLVTEDWYFCSHRLALAQAAIQAGYDVTVVTRVRMHGDEIKRAGLRLIELDIARSSLNPFGDARLLARLLAIYRRERPSIVHHVAMKPVLYGSLAARLSGRPHVVNALAGMGWLFTANSTTARALGPAIRWSLRRALGSGTALVQNPDDARLVEQLGVPAVHIRRIPGSGVDLARFVPPATEPGGDLVVLLHARLLRDKGVGEFVEAARALRSAGIAARFVLAGEPDPSNPSSFTPEQVARWVAEGVVEHRGWMTDIPSLLQRSHIVCLPSYREGLPKSLVEAAAAGRPIVTTDVPGCREVVVDGLNGLLVPPREWKPLAAALRRLLENAGLRREMGIRGRARAEERFGLDAIIGQTLAAYESAV